MFLQIKRFLLIGVLGSVLFVTSGFAWNVEQVSPNGHTALLRVGGGDSMENMEIGGVVFFKNKRNGLVRFVVRKMTSDTLTITSRKLKLTVGDLYEHVPAPSLDEIRAIEEESDERSGAENVLSVGIKPVPLIFDDTFRIAFGLGLKNPWEGTAELSLFNTRDNAAGIDFQSQGAYLTGGMNYYFSNETFHGFYAGAWFALGTMDTEFKVSNSKAKASSTVLGFGARAGYRYQTSFAKMFVASGLSPGFWSSKTSAKAGGVTGAFFYRKAFNWGYDELLQIGVVF